MILRTNRLLNLHLILILAPALVVLTAIASGIEGSARNMGMGVDCIIELPGGLTHYLDFTFLQR